MRRLLTTFILAFLSWVTWGQELSFTTTADTNRILIGEQIVISLKATIPSGQNFNWPVYVDTVSGLELVEASKADTLSNSGIITISQTLTITSFDSGYVAFPPMTMVVADQNVTSPAIAIEVGMPQLNPDQELYDIKGPLEAPFNWMRAGLILLAALILIAGIIAFVKWRSNKKRSVPLTPEQKLSPYQYALQQIAEIEKEQLWQSGKVKEYYSRLTDVLRLYMERQMNINAMESTADEVVEKLKQISLPAELNEKLAQLFQLSALVKFAKSKPGIDENEKALHTAKDFLNYTRPVETEGENKQPEK